MSLILECKESTKPHPEGIYAGVCVDVVELGLEESNFQGERKLQEKVKVFFETEYRDESGKAGLISRKFTASLHPKSRLSEYVAKWRGRPVLPGERVELEKLVGASCTLVISHQKSMEGRTYAAIDTVSKPTKKVAPSGQYDPAETRRRIAEWKAKEVRSAEGGVRSGASAPAAGGAGAVVPQHGTDGTNRANGGTQEQPKSGAAIQAAPKAPDFDPEVGF